jgi:hypothetical protein
VLLVLDVQESNLFVEEVWLCCRTVGQQQHVISFGLAKQEYNVLDLDVSNWDMFFFNKQDGQGAPTGGLIEQR